MELLQELLDCADEEETNLGNWLCVLFHTFVDSSEIHSHMQLAIRKAPHYLAVVLEHYKASIAVAQETEEKYGTFL